MYRYILIGTVALLAACAQKPNPVTTTQLQDVEVGYGLALSVAANYRELYDKNPCTKTRPLSTTNYCASRSVIVVLQDADRKVETALTVARNFIRDNPKVDASTYIIAAMNAVNEFKTIETQNGVK